MIPLPEILAAAERRNDPRMPSKKEAVEFLDGLVELLFPVGEGGTVSAAEMWADLQGRFARLVAPLLSGDAKAREVTDRFFGQIADIRAELLEDADHFVECDPASHSRQEVILCYPGFYAITVYRLAHAIHLSGVPILPRLLSEHAHSLTGIDIHPGAEIGRRFFIDHGTGVVIGETCVIGHGVKMYQGVTLGATFVTKDLQGSKRHPTIEDGVILYANCTILGGSTVIGRDSIIGGNVWLTESVPPGKKVFYKPEIAG